MYVCIYIYIIYKCNYLLDYSGPCSVTSSATSYMKMPINLGRFNDSTEQASSWRCKEKSNVLQFVPARRWKSFQSKKILFPSFSPNYLSGITNIDQDKMKSGTCL